MEKKAKLKPLDYDNLDLRNKTPYDFTDDEEILMSIGAAFKDLFMKALVEQGDSFRALSLLFYAEHIKDRKLQKAIEKEFRKDLDSLFDDSILDPNE